MKREMMEHNYKHNISNERLPLLGSFRDVDEKSRSSCLGFVKKPLNELKVFAKEAWEMGRSDPQKIIFAIKMGLALAIVSLLIFWKGIYDISQYSIWAILTVIVMFEYSIGATFIKGFNRLLGTLMAGLLAFCFAELSMLAGKWEKVVIVISIFVTGFFASYLKLYPIMKPYEYGFRVFILTYCILMVAGNRTREYTEAVVTRMVLIALGACVCLVVNVCIYPIWAGDALHSLVVKNFKDVANSLQGCVNGYLKCVHYERIPSRILNFQAYDDPLYNGYRSVVESTGKEDTLLGFAVWEPPHGRFKMFNYPWKNYAQVCGALRHCAFMVMALHGCILSEIQAPEELRRVFHSELKRVGAEAAKVMLELGNKVDKMEKLGTEDILKPVHESAEQLQRKIDEKSQNHINAKENENMQLGLKSLSETVIEFPGNLLKKQAPWPSRISFEGSQGFNKEDECSTYESASARSLTTFASLLVEFVARLQSLVDAFEELSEKAEFKEPILELESVIGENRKSGFCAALFKCLRF